MNETEKLLTIRAIARKTGLSEYFLRKCVHDGRLPVIMCGNRAKISISMLMDSLKQTSVSTEN